MCVVVIKKSKNPNYVFFIGINREEKYTKSWDIINNHWEQLPDVFGYKDIETDGTWFAYNKSLIAILVNKESDGYEHLKSRSHLVLKSLRSANNLSTVINNLSGVDMSQYKPFSLLLISRENVYWFTNHCDKELSNQLTVKVVENELAMINRSYPNDMNEKRISSNFSKFQIAQEPEPLKNEWSEWEQLLTTECFAEIPEQETCLWLNSKEWGTLLSDIVAVPKSENQSVIIHHGKERR